MIYQSPYTRDLGVNTCADCFEKQLEIDRLRVEVKRLKGLLHYRRQAAVAAPFGRPRRRQRYLSSRTLQRKKPLNTVGRTSVMRVMVGAR